MCCAKASVCSNVTAAAANSGVRLHDDDVEQRDAELDNVELSTAAQMEWDPQTDVASPMLPLQGLATASYHHANTSAYTVSNTALVRYGK